MDNRRGIDYTKNIQSEHKRNQSIIKLLITFCAVAILGTTYFAYRFATKSIDRIYVLSNGKSLLAAYESTTASNRPAEIRDQTQVFLNALLTLAPNKSQIDNSLSHAKLMGDQSIYSFIQNLLEQKYYDNLIASSTSSKFQLSDSINNASKHIEIDLRSYPYKVKVTGQQILIRTSNIEVRNFICQFYMRNIERSDENSHGLFIENFSVIDNSKIKDYDRRPKTEL